MTDRPGTGMQYEASTRQPLPSQRAAGPAAGPGLPRLDPTRLDPAGTATKPWYSRWWVVAIMLIAAMTLFSFVILALSPPTTVPSDTPVPSAAPTTAARVGGLNVPAVDGPLRFTVTAVRNGSTHLGPASSGTDARGSFTFVDLRIENTGAEPQALIGEAQGLYDQRNRRFTPDTQAALFLANSETVFAQIQPGGSVHGTLVYDLPLGTAPKEIELHASAFSDGVIVPLG